MIRIITPSDPVQKRFDTGLYLGGTIGVAKTDDWREKVKDAIKDADGLTVFDPVIADWVRVRNSKERKFNLHKQINWELEAQEESDYIVYYFSPTAKASFAFLELGFFATMNNSSQSAMNILVCCPKGFWKKDYIDVFCDRYNIDKVETFSEMIEIIQEWVK